MMLHFVFALCWSKLSSRYEQDTPLCIMSDSTVNLKQSEIWSQTPFLPHHNKEIILTISFRKNRRTSNLEGEICL